jgi:type II secretory pathway component PulM
LLEAILLEAAHVRRARVARIGAHVGFLADCYAQATTKGRDVLPWIGAPLMAAAVYVGNA